MKKTSGYSRTILAVFVANILFAPSSFAALTATPTQYGDNASAGAPTASAFGSYANASASDATAIGSNSKA
ncbi:hypothetical protein JTG49_005246, partial [Escherichia coli]|nr:hypothetical protein [Escherichia coli]